MNKFLALIPVLALAACGQPVVKDGDLAKKLESLGYSKVLITKQKLNCGRFGKGKHFIGTKKDGSKVIGQICYFKASRDVQYKVDINQTIVDTNGKPAVDIPNPWKKSK